MKFEVQILGSNSATPAHSRHPTAQVLNINEHLFLIDCGEGTLLRLNHFKVRFHRINHIFISHLHGDHYLGLIGLLSTMHLQGRKEELHIFSHAGLEEMINIQLHHSQSTLRFPVHFHLLDATKSKLIFENETMEVETIVLSHRIACTGFLFREKKLPRKLIIEKVTAHNIPLSFYPELKSGKDFIDETGKKIPNDELTIASHKERSYAYCSDTVYDERIISPLRNVDLLYHEATFMNDMEARAAETFHTTAAQAALIAKKAGAKKLLIGHFSARYKNLQPLLDEAREVFPETLLATEGDVFQVE